jgi:hypothetical protein
MARKAYPSDVSDEEWALVAPYLTLMTEEAPQREHPLREVFKRNMRLQVATPTRPARNTSLDAKLAGELAVVCYGSHLAEKMQELAHSLISSTLV